MKSAVVVGNPKPASRTLAAATYVAGELSGREADLVVDLADARSQAARLAGRRAWPSSSPRSAPRTWSWWRPRRTRRRTPGCSSCSSTGSPTDGLRGVAVPLMLGAGPAHALAPELTLRPVLTEIGGTVASAGYYVLDSRPRRPRGVRRLAGAGAPGRRRPRSRTGAARVTAPSAPSPPTRTSTRPGCARRSGSSRAGRRGRRRGRRRSSIGLAASSFTSVSLEPATGVVLGREHLEDLAGPAPGRAPRPHRARRPPRRGLPAAGRPGRAPLRRRRGHGDRRRRGHAGRGAGPLRLHGLPRGRGRRPHDRAAAAARGRARRTTSLPLVFHRSAFGRLSEPA